MLPAGHPHGRKFIIVGEWGPYDFRRPAVVLDQIKDDPAGKQIYTFRLLGPAGNWKLSQMRGFTHPGSGQGSIPAEFTVERNPAEEALYLEFEYTGAEPVTTVFGKNMTAAKPFLFDFQRFEKKWNWQLQFYNYDDASDPLKNPAAFEIFKKQKPAASLTTGELYYAWWGKPAEGVHEDRFATIASTTFTIAPGKYTLALTSDDGARLYLDGKKLIDHWDIHEPDTDEITVTLGGAHTIEIEHFDASGFSTLGLRINPAAE
jgi:hypothetical protein